MYAGEPGSGDGTGTGGDTDLSIANRGASTLDVASSTGTDATLPAATTALTGLQSAADKTKLDGVAAGANVNVGQEYTQTEKTKLAGVADGCNGGYNSAGIRSDYGKFRLEY